MSAEPARPSRRERKKAALRETIKDATLALVAEHGTEGTTIDAICDASDISRKTFYNYYSNKDDLLFDICVERLLDLTGGAIDEALEASTNLDQRLTHILARLRDHLRHSSRLEMEIAHYSITSIGQRLAGGGTLLSLMNNGFLRLFRESATQIRPGLSPEFCAEMTVGMVNAVILNHLHQPSYDAVRGYDALRDYLLESMVITEPARSGPAVPGGP